MPIPSFTNIEEFKRSVRELDRKVREGLERGNVAEMLSLKWDLVLAVATSNTDECNAEKEKPANKFLFQFMLAYGRARQQGRHYSAEFLEEMRLLLRNEGHNVPQFTREEVTSERHAGQTDLMPGIQKEVPQSSRQSDSMRRGSSKNNKPASHEVKPESGNESELSTATRPPKRRRVVPARAKRPKTFNEIEEISSDGESDSFTPLNNPSDPESGDETIKLRSKSRSKSLSSKARYTKPQTASRDTSERRTDNQPPQKATKWIHRRRCEMCAAHNRKCRVTYQTATCYYCNKHRRRCEGKGEEIERCSDVDDNESIDQDLEEDRNPKIPPRGTLTLIKVEESNTINQSRSVASEQPATGAASVLGQGPDFASSEVAVVEDKCLPLDMTKKEELNRVPLPPIDSPGVSAKKFPVEGMQTLKTAVPAPAMPPQESLKGKQRADPKIKGFNEWAQQDYVLHHSSQPPSLPPRPSYIRDWDFDEDAPQKASTSALSLEDRVKSLEKVVQKIIKKLKKIDQQLSSHDSGFDYMAGKLAFFVGMVEVLDNKFDILNHYHVEVVNRMTTMRKEINFMAKHFYEGQSSSEDEELTHQSPKEHPQDVDKSDNPATSPEAFPMDVDSTYIPVHSPEKLAAWSRQWSGGSSDQPINLEEEHTDLSNIADHKNDQLADKMSLDIKTDDEAPAKQVNDADSLAKPAEATLPTSSKGHSVNQTAAHALPNTVPAQLDIGDSSTAVDPMVIEESTNLSDVADHKDNQLTDKISSKAEVWYGKISDRDAEGEAKVAGSSTPHCSPPHISHDKPSSAAMPHASHDKPCLDLVLYRQPTPATFSAFSSMHLPPLISIPKIHIGPDGNILPRPEPHNEDDDLVEY